MAMKKAAGGAIPQWRAPAGAGMQRSARTERTEAERFRYQHSQYQIEYSRNLIFVFGGQMGQAFPAPIDRSWAPPGLPTMKPS